MVFVTMAGVEIVKTTSKQLVRCSVVLVNRPASRPMFTPSRAWRRARSGPLAASSHRSSADHIVLVVMKATVLTLSVKHARMIVVISKQLDQGDEYLS